MCLWIAETVIVILVGKERIANTLQPDKPFDEYIYNIIFLCILTPHFLLPIASWRYAGEVAKYKNMWTHYQVRRPAWQDQRRDVMFNLLSFTAEVLQSDRIHSGVSKLETDVHISLHSVMADIHRRSRITVLFTAWFYHVAHFGVLSHYSYVRLPLRFMVDQLHRDRISVKGSCTESSQGTLSTFLCLLRHTDCYL